MREKHSSIFPLSYGSLWGTEKRENSPLYLSRVRLPVWTCVCSAAPGFPAPRSFRNRSSGCHDMPPSLTLTEDWNSETWHLGAVLSWRDPCACRPPRRLPALYWAGAPSPPWHCILRGCGRGRTASPCPVLLWLSGPVSWSERSVRVQSHPIIDKREGAVFILRTPSKGPLSVQRVVWTSWPVTYEVCSQPCDWLRTNKSLKNSRTSGVYCQFPPKLLIRKQAIRAKSVLSSGFSVPCTSA